MPQAAGKEERIDLRLTKDQKDLIKSAADESGLSVTSFIVLHIQNAANQVIRERTVLNLSLRDQERILQALDNPPEPNERLKRAFERRRRMVVNR